MIQLSRTLLCVAVAALFCVSAQAVGVGQQAPDFGFLQSWNMPAGKKRLSDFRGSVVLLECWATWCPPCRKIIPHMREINSVYAPQGLNIISVSDESTGLISNFMREQNMDYPVVRAEGVLSMYGRTTIPSAWLIDAGGKVIWVGHPAELDSGKLAQAVNGQLNSTVTGGPTSDSGLDGSNWWVWLIVLPALLFAGAMGWFVWSTRDKTARNVQTAWHQPPANAPQPNAPPPRGQAYAPQQPLPPQSAYPPPQGQPVPPAYSAPQQPPAPQFGGSPPPAQPGPADADGPMPELRRQPDPDSHYLGQNPDGGDDQFPPYNTNQNRPGNPYR